MSQTPHYEEKVTRDPELVEDEVDDLGDDEYIVLPEYDGSAFEVSQDYEYEGGDEDGSEDER